MIKLKRTYSPRINVKIHAIRNGIAHQIPTAVILYLRIPIDAISRIKIIIVKTNCIMDKIRTGNLGNVDRQLVSYSELFDDL
jgi:hypothetical protein